ncbi:MAG: response regulator transcription factor [Crocinitomicaceae bacterium]|nr:response regulator transcription factor [Crocinitomicaceae bacterium]
MKKQKILIVEDEENILETLQLNLDLEGYALETAVDGEEALSKFKSFQPDLVLLDVMLPKKSGYDVCREIRTYSNVPILFLSAKGTTQDRIFGLKLGANDYLPKPFDLEELLLRIQILLAPLQEQEKETSNFKIGDFEVDFKNFKTDSRSGEVGLTKKECELLKYIVSRPNEVISRNEILDHVWGEEKYPTSRTIDNFILNFRKYFEDNPKQPKYFQSIRGVGYKFTP